MYFENKIICADTLDKCKKWFLVCYLQMKRVIGKKGFFKVFLANEGFNGPNGFRRGEGGKS